MQLNLVAHPSTPPSDPGIKVWASVEHAGALGGTATTNLWFGIGAPAARFVIAQGEAERTDELWRTTCFEAFVAAPSEMYREWNFAPSGQWAAYDFTGYREGMHNAAVDHPPYIRMEDNLTWWAVGATIAVGAGAEWRLGLSAVLEEKDGIKSYWALAHPNPERPDFHDPACFTARLA
jgi:hypothetical protein